MLPDHFRSQKVINQWLYLTVPIFTSLSLYHIHQLQFKLILMEKRSLYL